MLPYHPLGIPTAFIACDGLPIELLEYLGTHHRDRRVPPSVEA